MRGSLFSKTKAFLVTACLAVTLASSVESAAMLQPEPEVATTRKIAPKYASLSDPAVTTTRTAKEYYLDLERCRSDIAHAIGGAGSDDVAALRRALATQSDASTVKVHYDAGDRALVRDRAVKACLTRKGYAVGQ